MSEKQQNKITTKKKHKSINKTATKKKHIHRTIIISINGIKLMKN